MKKVDWIKFILFFGNPNNCVLTTAALNDVGYFLGHHSESQNKKIFILTTSKLFKL